MAHVLLPLSVTTRHNHILRDGESKHCLPPGVASQTKHGHALRDPEFRKNQTCTELWLPFGVAFPPFPDGNLPFSGAGGPPISVGDPTISIELRA